MLKRGFIRLLLLPLQLILPVLLTLVDWLRLLRWERNLSSQPSSPDLSLCSIIVLNWNGRHLLQESLPALEAAIKRSGRPHELLVVDNGSDDDSGSWVKQYHPQAKLLQLSRNFGFAGGNNRGVAAARYEIVMLVNNDMIVAPDFLDPLLQAFHDPEVFAVSSQIFFPPGKIREETGSTLGNWRRGRLELSHGKVKSYHFKRGYLPVLWAGGGSSAFCRRRFLQLGGFSEIFSPCYVEDTDLSYRAWRRGWKVLFCPRSQVLHKHRSSTRHRFPEQQLTRMIEVRKLWYLWKNYQLATLIPHFLAFFGSGLDPWAPVRALRRLPWVLAARWREPARRVKDRQLFKWVRQPLTFLNRFQPDRRPASRDRCLKILSVSAYLPGLGKHGGAGRVYQLLSRAAQRHQVSLIAFLESVEEEREMARLRPFCDRIEAVFRNHYKPVSLFPYEPFEEFNTSAFRDRLSQLLLEEDFDLVHFEWPQMATYTDLFPNIPKLLTEVEVNYAAHQTQVRLQANLWRRLWQHYRTLQTLRRELQQCRRVDKVICVTDQDRDYLQGYLDTSQLEVLNTGVDTTYFRPQPAERSRPGTLIYVGAFRHSPNVDAMLFFCREVFPAILEAEPETQLYIVGTGPPSAIRNLQGPQVTVTGFVDDLREYYARAQVVIIPLRTGVGIRGKLLEAWAAERAVVATSLACLGIRVSQGENILVADSPRDFADWTVALLRNPRHCLRLGRAGRRLAQKHYEWDQLGEQMSTLYEKACQEARPQRPTVASNPLAETEER